MVLLHNGALAQLGERLICIQEVRSSILLGSTIIEEVYVIPTLVGCLIFDIVNRFFVSLVLPVTDERYRIDTSNNNLTAECHRVWSFILWIWWCSQVTKGHLVDALAYGGDERRDRLRKASGSRQ